jgi:hypothetical protein
VVGKAMGITYVTGPVRGPTGEEAEVRFLMDSAAIYAPLAKCYIILPQGKAHTPGSSGGCCWCEGAG